MMWRLAAAARITGSGILYPKGCYSSPPVWTFKATASRRRRGALESARSPGSSTTRSSEGIRRPRLQVWRDLDDWLLKVYPHTSGTVLRIASACVDSGGHATQQVYDFCRKRESRRIWAIIGRSGAGLAALETHPAAHPGEGGLGNRRDGHGEGAALLPAWACRNSVPGTSIFHGMWMTSGLNSSPPRS